MSVLPPTLDPPARRRATTPPPPPPSRRRMPIDVATLAWPLGLVLLLAALAAWRSTGDDPAASSAVVAATPVLAARAFGELRLPVPREWVTLDRGDERVTWGTPARTHTVTLAGTDAASTPLIAVVREVARQSTDALPGTRVVDGPTIVEPDERMARGDSFVVVEFEVDEGPGRLRVVQAWRRDSRASRDLVATWTSTDGAWPVDPRRALPATSGTG